MDDSMHLSEARNGLLRLWMIGVCVPITILIIQSIFGKYDDNLQEIWSWFIPTSIPTLGLMVGVLGATALVQSPNRLVKKEFYKAAYRLSAFYLIVLSATILLEPFSPKPPAELFILSNYWLSPIQGLTAAALGFLFTSEQDEAP